MRRLNPVDTAFLLAESRNQPLHVGALCLFHPPEGEVGDFTAAIAERLRSSRSCAPPFNHRLTSRWGIRSWAEADDFDIGQHFVHLSLPRPGRILELLAMVSRVHSAHLDRAYPLWRMYLIEGIEDGRIALYSKIHHSLVDGVAGLRVMMKTMASSPQESLMRSAPWELQPAGVRSPSVAGAAVEGASAVMHLLRDGVASAPAVLRQVRQLAADLRAHHPHAVSSFQAPNSILNSRISGSRRFAAQSYSTQRIKAIARSVDATTNDVVLALCGSALRNYLLELGALPDEPLIAAVPVSLRKDESESGNQVAAALANLGTHIADPVERVRLVKGSMDYIKQMLGDMSPAQVMAYTAATLAPAVGTLLPGISSHRRAANVVISHVRGPQTDTYWQGCKLDGIYPASLVLNGFALNITLVSRHDNIDFGIIACRRSLPSVQRLLNLIEASIVELETALDLTYDPASEPSDCKAINSYCLYPPQPSFDVA